LLDKRIVAPLKWLFIVSCLIFPDTSLAFTLDDSVKIAAAKPWVIARNAVLDSDIPTDEISNGIFYRLLDSQVKIEAQGQRSHFSRYVETVVNQTGIESASQINISFDPTYQNLVLNSLVVIRDGKRLDRINSAKIATYRTEQELDRQIYSDELTLNILIDDVRLGDTLDYSYTRLGANPVYNNIFSYVRGIGWSVPVYDQYIRLLWGKSAPLYIDTADAKPIIEKTKLGKFTEYSLYLNNEKTLPYESQAPDWYDPYAVISFNELEHWHDVVQWALPLYRFEPVGDSVQKIATSIKQQHQTKTQQIAAALKYTQQQIRYVGLEMGANSHRPTPAAQTLSLRYGDCKDKAVLFIALLAALDIQAFPALVHTDDTKSLPTKPPSLNNFNHVIVTLQHLGKRVWLDPTLSNQYGDFENIYQPDYGYALIIAPEQQALSPMASSDHNSYTHIVENYVIGTQRQDPVSFSVNTKYLGDDAQSQYAKLERDGKNKLAQSFVNFYQKTYPDLIVSAPLTVSSDNRSGVLTFAENYSIGDFWTKSGNDYEFYFYPNEIRDAVYQPKRSERTAPLRFNYPNNIKHHASVEFTSKNWSFDDEEFVEDNPYFYFKKEVKFVSNTLSLHYSYRAKTDHIPAAEISDYLAARERLRDQTYYGLQKYGEETAASEQDSGYNWPLIIIVVYTLGLIYIIAEWRIESKRRPSFENSAFYPLAPLNFLVLSTLTFGLYESYWLYRNWKYIQGQRKSPMMPIARGIFSYIWFYPLFNALRQDSENRFAANKVQATLLAVAFSALYVAIVLLSNVIDYASLLFDSMADAARFETAFYTLWFASPLLFLPMLNYINWINSKDQSALRYNSTWRIRHGVIALLILPVLAVVVAQQLNVIPSSSVVAGRDMMSHDIKFLQRHKIIPASQNVEYFYSEAFLSMQDEGNGFTKRNVFSYWLDDDGKLTQRTAAFDAVEDIAVKYGANDDDTIITITHADGNSFRLFVASEQKKDKVFAKYLLKWWQLGRGDSEP